MIDPRLGEALHNACVHAVVSLTTRPELSIWVVWLPSRAGSVLVMRDFLYDWDTCAVCAAASMEVGALLLPPAMITDALNPEAVALLREPPMQLSLRADAAPGVQMQPVCVRSQTL